MNIQILFREENKILWLIVRTLFKIYQKSPQAIYSKAVPSVSRRPTSDIVQISSRIFFTFKLHILLQPGCDNKCPSQHPTFVILNKARPWSNILDTGRSSSRGHFLLRTLRIVQIPRLNLDCSGFRQRFVTGSTKRLLSAKLISCNLEFG